MAGGRTVKIDALPESACRYSGYDAIVCVDVLLSATTIVTAVAQGRRVFSSSTPAEGLAVKARHADARPRDRRPGADSTGPCSSPARPG